MSRWCESAAAVFGYETGEARALRFADLFPREDREIGKPEITLARAREFGCWDETGWRVNHAGDPVSVAMSVKLVRTPNGLEIGYHVATRELGPTGASVSLRGQDAEEVLRLLALGRLSSDVAHELNNLLAALRGFVYVIERHLPGTGTPHEAWHQMVKACDRGTDLTRRLLGIGRPGDAGLKAVDVVATIRELEPLLKQVLPERVRLVTALSPGLPHVIARARDVDLALLNLVVNARDAIEANGTIAIQARLDEAGGEGVPRVALSVRDSGAGMSDEVRRRAFERFFTTKASEAGTGLGLSLVRDAVHSWGGSVELASEPGSGTCVTLRLMIAGSAALQEDLFSIHAKAPAAPRPRIMVCAPLPSRVLIADLLTRRGYAVVPVESQEEVQNAFDGAGAKVDVLVVGGPAAVNEGAPLVETLKKMSAPPAAVVFFAPEARPVTSPWAEYPTCRFLWGPVVPDLLVEVIERSVHAGPAPGGAARVH